MLPYFLLGLALLAGVLLLIRWAVSAEPKALLKAFRWLALILGGALVVFLALTGRLAWAFVALPALIPWFMRLRGLARAAKNFSRMAQGGGPGASAVNTRFVNMTLDHTSGDMNGTVNEGPHAGRALDSLTLEELIGLLGQCWEEDEQSARVLESYLDRVHEGWREQAGAPPGGEGGGAAFAEGPMSREEAYRILGLEPGASEPEIKEAHRRLMAGLHPDHGGSTYLAAKINQAKEVLLGKG